MSIVPFANTVTAVGSHVNYTCLQQRELSIYDKKAIGSECDIMQLVRISSRATDHSAPTSYSVRFRQAG